MVGCSSLCEDFLAFFADDAADGDDEEEDAAMVGVFVVLSRLRFDSFVAPPALLAVFAWVCVLVFAAFLDWSLIAQGDNEAGVQVYTSSELKLVKRRLVRVDR